MRCNPDQVADDFAAWLKGCGWDGQTALTPAGKNFASFDRQFLKRLPRFEQVVKLHHRTLDPAVLFWQAGRRKAARQQDLLRAGRAGRQSGPHRRGRCPGGRAAGTTGHQTT